jgi:hypothetical protein
MKATDIPLRKFHSEWLKEVQTKKQPGTSTVDHSSIPIYFPFGVTERSACESVMSDVDSLWVGTAARSESFFREPEYKYIGNGKSAF